MTGPHGLWIGFAAVLLALMIDQWIGEPPPRWHPVVWMGNYLGRAGRWLQAHVRPQGADWPSFWRGALAWWGGALLVLVLAGALQWLLLISMGAFGAIGHFLLIKAYTLITASELSPWLNAQVVAATLYSVFLFQDVLGWNFFLGTGLIVGAGVLLWWQNRRA